VEQPVTRQLSTHPGVGPLTAPVFELVIGTPERFTCAKQIGGYVGLVPSEESSGDQPRLGHISKQGNVLLCFLLVEAAQVTVRSDSPWRSQFFHLAMRRGRKIAKVAMARKLAVELYLDVGGTDGITPKCKSSVRRVENPALMLESPWLPPDSRGCEVPESSE
jgi:transposase